jgi:APA family basic amino acid/polyamine antiporter
MILSGARVTYAMAKEGLFFKKTGELNKAQVPAFALWIQCAWASLLCLSGTYSALLDYVIFVSLLFWAITAIGIFILRIKEPNLPRPYRVWGYPILPALFIFLCLSICSILLITKTENSGRGLLILLIGIPFYFLLKKRSVTN